MLKTTRAHLRSTSPGMSLFTSAAVLLLVFLAANAGLVERTYTKPTFYKVGIVGASDNYRFCGATVIGARWLLTAAECLVSRANGRFYPPSELRVRVEVFNYDVERVEPHSAFQFESNGRTYLSNNVALVKTTSDMANWPWYKISLPTTEVNYEGNNCTVTGWETDDWKHQYSCSKANPENLLVTTGTVLAESVCDAQIPTMFDAHNDICFSKMVNTACIKDDGGPLICEDKIVGVAKYGGADKCPGVRPRVYTKVFWHLNWIRQYTGITA